MIKLKKSFFLIILGCLSINLLACNKSKDSYNLPSNSKNPKIPNPYSDSNSLKPSLSEDNKGDYTPKKILNNTRKFGVRVTPIGSSNQGSGIILSSKRENYYCVLTAKHVANSYGGNFELLLPDGFTHTATPKEIREIEGVDATLITFYIERDYDTPTLSFSKPQQDDILYIYDVLQSSSNSKLITVKFKSTVPGIDYNMEYIDPKFGKSFRNGVSGSPILNQKGQVIGIHLGISLSNAYGVSIGSLPLCE